MRRGETYTDDKPIPIVCPNVGIRLHIKDHQIPDQHIEIAYRAIPKNFISALSNSPVKLTCPTISSEAFQSVPLRLDSTGKY